MGKEKLHFNSKTIHGGQRRLKRCARGVVGATVFIPLINQDKDDDFFRKKMWIWVDSNTFVLKFF